MAKRIYLDTNIYLDYFLSRVDRLRPLGDFAFNLISRAIKGEFKLIVSSLVIAEIGFNNLSNEFNTLIKELEENGALILVYENEEDIDEAKKLMKIHNTPYNDTRHIVLAKKSKADYFVTRNINDVAELKEHISIVYPENI